MRIVKILICSVAHVLIFLGVFSQITKMSLKEDSVQCYNRGCGQKFDPNNNAADSCTHHPGLPVFHDAYKGWSCCSKKCTDFTEFLNIKGCTLSKHSNIKPPEPEKPTEKQVVEDEPVISKPITPKRLDRPSFNTPMVVMAPELAPSLVQQQKSVETKQVIEETSDPSEIAVGTVCQNRGCGIKYEGPETNGVTCVYHPGVPIFHEGLKYWSCCQRKTTDFNTFLSQIGCGRGTHIWKIKESDEKTVQCRWDFHQTAPNVIVSIYAKQYCPKESVIKLSPVRLFAKLVFPQESNAHFLLDVELRGIADVDASHVTMYGTKVEIKLKKAEPGSWINLGDPVKSEVARNESEIQKICPQVEAVDLDDI